MDVVVDSIHHVNRPSITRSNRRQSARRPEPWESGAARLRRSRRVRGRSSQGHRRCKALQKGIGGRRRRRQQQGKGSSIIPVRRQ
ncbi:hypothetical protein DAI22_07g084301 [Oryza sativa Japonica Group]|nr:hypothetical protein DAI22_07g084301 [Oryza sativa Japonica Group]